MKCKEKSMCGVQQAGKRPNGGSGGCVEGVKILIAFKRNADCVYSL